MDNLRKSLEQREKNELIAIITHMLRQEPDLQWLLLTPLPTVSSRKSPLDPEVYRQQVLAAMSAGDFQRKRKRGEVQRRLTAIKAIADELPHRNSMLRLSPFTKCWSPRSLHTSMTTGMSMSHSALFL
jgi:hypothetical protein